VADANGNAQVFINDIGPSTGANRSWFDGVAYKPTDAAALTPTATLDRNTGSLTLNNATSLGRDIKAIRIESIATGGLNATTWTSVHSTDANWTITEPVDPPNTPFASNLVENGTTTVTLAANGGSLSFGDVWN